MTSTLQAINSSSLDKIQQLNGVQEKSQRHSTVIFILTILNVNSITIIDLMPCEQVACVALICMLIFLKALRIFQHNVYKLMTQVNKPKLD